MQLLRSHSNNNSSSKLIFSLFAASKLSAVRAAKPGFQSIPPLLGPRRPGVRGYKSSAAMSKPFSETTGAVRPSRSLEGKVALVTGAGAAGDGLGNGRASSILLAEAGAKVVCVDIDLASAKRTVEMIKAEGKSDAVALSADVTDQKSCERVVGDAVAFGGRLDILVCIVGVMGAKGNAVDVDMVEWANTVQVNVNSMVLMAKYAIPAMLKNTEGPCRGSIVTIGSVAGLKGGTPHLAYPTTKGAVVNMTRAMATHHGHQGIRVNCVCPGMVYTPMVYQGNMSDEIRQQRRERSVLKTEGTAWDTAAAVRFLSSDEARWITGVVLAVDAGTTCSTSIELGSHEIK